AISEVVAVSRLPRLELLVPVADKDRMLWLAEKATELGITAWQPVVYARSRSVSPRGEGPAFADKVRARMQSALEQSGGAWLPEVRPERTLNDAIAASTVRTHFVLAREAPALPELGPFGEASIALGPEGGLEYAELEALRARGWRAAGLARST